MCGIFAYFNNTRMRSSSVSEESLKKSVELTSYRGPDNTGFKSFFRDSDIKAFLGHNRLSIIDLSEDGNQPFSIDNKYHIVFNGEIYNFLEIRESLIQKGYTFSTKSDTEVLLKLYIDSGTSRFNELNGMWAFVIYDETKNIAVVSRDRFGVKPLYIHKKPEGLFFASEIKQLLSFVEVKSVNENVLSHYLYSYLIDYNNDTFFKGIEKCPAMHSLIINLDNFEIKKEKYWEFSSLELDGYSEDELINDYRELLISSITLRQRSDVKVGNSLSGGLDSSSIALLANSISDQPIYNFSVIGNDIKTSEEVFIDELIKRKNLNVHKINFDEINPWLDVERVILHHDEPILSLSTIAHFKMMQSLKENSDIVVVLSGQGGDESLAGYNKYFYFNIKELISKGSFINAGYELFCLAPKLLGEFKWNFAKRYVSKKSKLEEYISIKNNTINLLNSTLLLDRQKEDILKFSVPALCHYEDRNSMANSLEIRLPFLDYRLVNYSLNLPSKMKIRGGQNKYILRKAIPELPDLIKNRKDKKGFTVNESSAKNSTFIELFTNNFTNSVLGQLDIVDEKKLQNELNLLKQGKNVLWERELHRLLFAEIWAKKFLK